MTRQRHVEAHDVRLPEQCLLVDPLDRLIERDRREVVGQNLATERREQTDHPGANPAHPDDPDRDLLKSTPLDTLPDPGADSPVGDMDTPEE